MTINENRNADKTRASWQLPAGVSRGTWDYVTESAIATDYDRFHAGHPLLEMDRKWIIEHLGESPSRADGTPRIAIDFGCGTGRNLIPLAERGWRVVGVDLSLDMLREFKGKARQLPNAEAAAIRGNMAHMECLADSFADAVLCMYSSLGMVQGRENRISFMRHANRILNKNGKFFVHVHNRGFFAARSRRSASYVLGLVEIKTGFRLGAWRQCLRLSRSAVYVFAYLLGTRTAKRFEE